MHIIAELIATRATKCAALCPFFVLIYPVLDLILFLL